MEFQKTTIKGLILIKPRVFTDDRGSFTSPFIKKQYEENGIQEDWVQENVSVTKSKGMIRGLHFQKGKDVQAKLVTVVRGKAFVAVVDLRKNSETYGKWESFELDADKKNLVYVPAGFAHGFLTLEDNTIYSYKVSNYYAPQSEGGLRWNDPEVGIEWPIANPTMNERDANWPTFAELRKQDLFG